MNPRSIFSCHVKRPLPIMYLMIPTTWQRMSPMTQNTTLFEYPHTLRIPRSSGTAVEAWWTSFGLMWVSLTIWEHSDREGEVKYPWIAQDGLGNREHPDVWYIRMLRQEVQGMVDILGRSEYPQHVKILRQGGWGMEDILDIHGCSEREFGAWWTSLDRLHSSCLLTL